MLNLLERMAADGHERVIHACDEAAGYRAIIAIHDRTLGPALGGTRMLAYASAGEALDDVLRLSRGMTYKGALAGLAIGGGKAVILAPPPDHDRAAIFRAHGRFVETLAGEYLTSVDIGTSPDDMEFVRETTTHVVGLRDRSGDPSPSTARGVLRAMQAVQRYRNGTDDLRGLRVAVQGCGHVGAALARQLHAEGARLVVADIEPARAAIVASLTGASILSPDTIHAADVDVFAPCARGAVLDDETIPSIRAWAVVGAANNQLRHQRHDELLRARGITYAPDYAANAGGLIHLTREFAGVTAADAALAVDRIHETIIAVLARSDELAIGTQAAADSLAEKRLHAGVELAPALARSARFR